MGCGKIFDAQDLFGTKLRVPSGEETLQFAAHHRGDNVIGRRFTADEMSDYRAIAQDRHAVNQIKHFLELVGDEDES